jgi:hypothetical protein
MSIRREGEAKYSLPSQTHTGFGGKQTEGLFKRKEETRERERLTMHRAPIAWLSPGVGHL